MLILGGLAFKTPGTSNTRGVSWYAKDISTMQLWTGADLGGYDAGATALSRLNKFLK